MATSNTHYRLLALALIISAQVLLFVGYVYGVLSARLWAFATLACFAIVLLWVSVRRFAAKENRPSRSERESPLDELTRKRLLRSIRFEKVWIAALAVCLPVGIVNGMEQHLYWPLAIGIGINLSLMYVAIGRIKRLKSRLEPSNLPTSS